jgi:hypothetical protein
VCRGHNHIGSLQYLYGTAYDYQTRSRTPFFGCPIRYAPCGSLHGHSINVNTIPGANPIFANEYYVVCCASIDERCKPNHILECRASGRHIYQLPAFQGVVRHGHDDAAIPKSWKLNSSNIKHPIQTSVHGRVNGRGCEWPRGTNSPCRPAWRLSLSTTHPRPRHRLLQTSTRATYMELPHNAPAGSRIFSTSALYPPPPPMSNPSALYPLHI